MVSKNDHIVDDVVGLLLYCYYYYRFFTTTGQQKADNFTALPLLYYFTSATDFISMFQFLFLFSV